MKVKILKSDLIRTFGGAIVEMQEAQANRYIKSGYAIAYNPPPSNKDKYGNNKDMDKPEENKMVWSPPEKKVFDPNGKEKLSSASYPGPNDPLFPQI